MTRVAGECQVSVHKTSFGPILNKFVAEFLNILMTYFKAQLSTGKIQSELIKNMALRIRTQFSVWKSFLQATTAKNDYLV